LSRDLQIRARFASANSAEPESRQPGFVTKSGDEHRRRIKQDENQEPRAWIEIRVNSRNSVQYPNAFLLEVSLRSFLPVFVSFTS